MRIHQANDYYNLNKNIINSKYRGEYHVFSPLGWINDPNGFSFYNDKYHLFFQYHPYSQEWGPMHWGHSTSDNLLDWRYEGVALAPKGTRSNDDACFSGCGFVENDIHHLMYTVHSKDRQSQTIATSTDGLHYLNITEKPLFDASIVPKDLHVPLTEFRDPFTYKKNGLFYCILAALNSKKDVGMILLFESKNLLEWKYKGKLLEGTKDIGRMWECPVLLEINGKDVILASIQDMKAKGYKYSNMTSSLYFVGKIDYSNGSFESYHTDEIDSGFEYYANQVLSKDGKHYLISWVEAISRGNVLTDLKHGYTGVLSAPREITLNGNQLVQKPIKKLIDRHELTSSPKKITSTSYRIELEFEVARDSTFNISINNNEEELLIYYRNNILTMDRSKSGYLPKYFSSLDDSSERRSINLCSKDKLTLDIYIDNSIFEMFVNNGLNTFTSKIYPKDSYTTLNIEQTSCNLLKQNIYNYNKSL